MKDVSSITVASRLAISYRAVGDLIPDPRNARTHSKRQIDQIKASIEAFGFTNPIPVDPEGHIIAGHGRLQAARAMGLMRFQPSSCRGSRSPRTAANGQETRSLSRDCTDGPRTVARRGGLGAPRSDTQSRRSADRRECYSYTSQGQMAQMVDRNSIIRNTSRFLQVSWPRLVAAPLRSQLRPRHLAGLGTKLETTRLDIVWMQ